MEGALPGPQGHLGDKADLTPSPLRVSGSHRGGLTGETNDVVRSYGFALTEQASVTLLMPRRNHCSPGLAGPEGRRRGNGAERNRTAVRNTGVDHLVVPEGATSEVWHWHPGHGAASAGGQHRTSRSPRGPASLFTPSSQPGGPSQGGTALAESWLSWLQQGERGVPGATEGHIQHKLCRRFLGAARFRVIHRRP